MKHPLAAVLFAGLLISCNPQPDDPLIGAARSGNTQAITTLLAGGTDPNQRWGINSWTPLMHAIHKNQKGSVVALLAGGADVNARAGSQGITALIMAAGYATPRSCNCSWTKAPIPMLKLPMATALWPLPLAVFPISTNSPWATARPQPLPLYSKKPQT